MSKLIEFFNEKMESFLCPANRVMNLSLSLILLLFVIIMNTPFWNVVSENAAINNMNYSPANFYELTAVGDDYHGTLEITLKNFDELDDKTKNVAIEFLEKYKSKTTAELKNEVLDCSKTVGLKNGEVITVEFKAGIIDRNTSPAQLKIEGLNSYTIDPFDTSLFKIGLEENEIMYGTTVMSDEFKSIPDNVIAQLEYVVKYDDASGMVTVGLTKSVNEINSYFKEKKIPYKITRDSASVNELPIAYEPNFNDFNKKDLHDFLFDMVEDNTKYEVARIGLLSKSTRYANNLGIYFVSAELICDGKPKRYDLEFNAAMIDGELVVNYKTYGALTLNLVISADDPNNIYKPDYDLVNTDIPLIKF